MKSGFQNGDAQFAIVMRTSYSPKLYFSQANTTFILLHVELQALHVTLILNTLLQVCLVK